MAVEVTDTDLTTLMVTTQVVNHSLVDHNHHHTDRVTIPTDTRIIVLGVLVEMVLSTVTVVLEDVKVLSSSKNFTVDK
tara:strand:+ start:224 stop:457 length:234 start_codon:yes stop_codon:yes gene_type:complete